MGAVPKHRISKSKGAKRRAAKKLATPKLVECSTCRHLKRPHEVCGFCGKYKSDSKSKK